MIRRGGATLIEVLTAIFVMGIGLLALLALFPLGAINMAQGIKDSRTAHAARSAAAVLQARAMHRDATVVPLYTNPGLGDPTQLDAFPDGRGYPVYIDPIGARSYQSPWSSRVGGVALGQGPIPRLAPLL